MQQVTKTQFFNKISDLDAIVPRAEIVINPGYSKSNFRLRQSNQLLGYIEDFDYGSRSEYFLN